MKEQQKRDPRCKFYPWVQLSSTNFVASFTRVIRLSLVTFPSSNFAETGYHRREFSRSLGQPDIDERYRKSFLSTFNTKWSNSFYLRLPVDSALVMQCNLSVVYWNSSYTSVSIRISIVLFNSRFQLNFARLTLISSFSPLFIRNLVIVLSMLNII